MRRNPTTRTDSPEPPPANGPLRSVPPRKRPLLLAAIVLLMLAWLGFLATLAFR